MRGRAGFTVVEVLLALGILTVAFLGLISVLMTGHTDISQSGRDTAASVAAQSLAENMRNQPATDWQQLNGMTTANAAQCPGSVGTRLNTLCTEWIAQVTLLPRGRGTVAVTATPGNGSTLWTATITVTWTEATRRGVRQLALVVGRSG